MNIARKSIILTVLLALLLAAASSGESTRANSVLDRLKNPSGDYILVVSHRGDWRYAPENSLPAVQRCIDLGVDIVEIDVRLTKDGHLVAMHDKTVDRTTNGSGLVSEMTLKDIKSLRLKNACGIQGSRHQVPTLEEIMLLARGNILINLDKTESVTVREAYKVLKATGTVDHAIFKGNESVELMRSKYGELMDKIIYMPKVWYSMSNPNEYIDSYNREIAPIAYEMIFDSAECEVFNAIDILNRQKISVLCIALWDELCAGRTDELALLEGPESAWGWLIGKGANALMTDRPSELLSFLKRRGLHD